MLKIEKIRLSGFKSFCDATEVAFPRGITAVVGPNGCGKSNIGDAINWVLGEQSARMLRGASMQDVIFSGSEARNATGMAEVELTLADAAVGADDPRRVTIARRLFRDGESEYLLGGARARLRDIQDLLREERVGAQTYATIEQGRIDQILNAKPKDRRLIIEEAAGVAGFKHKRRLAELKLEATEANLLRVQDVLSEVTRQINSLKRQAAKARRYRRLRDELRSKESLLFALRAKGLDDALERRRREEAEARDLESRAAAGLAGLEADLVASREELERIEGGARERAEDLHRLRMEVERAEGTIRASRERIAESEAASEKLRLEAESGSARRAELLERKAAHDAAAREAERERERVLARLAARHAEAEKTETEVAGRRESVESLRAQLFAAVRSLAEARNHLRALEEGAARAGTTRERLLAEREDAIAEARSIEEAAATLGALSETHRAEHAAAIEALQAAEQGLLASRARALTVASLASAAREREQSAASRLATLEDVATRFAGVSDGVRTVLGAGAGSGVRSLGIVADFVEAQPDFEAAAEAYLQGLLPAVIVEDDEDACNAAALLEREGAGRTLLLCRTQPPGALAVGVPSNGRPPMPEDFSDDPRVVGRLKDRIRLRAGDGFVSERIGDAVLVDSLESALALHRRHAGCDYVTPTGDVVFASGLVAAGGGGRGDRGLLAHNRKIQAAREGLTRATDEAERRAAELEAARGGEREAEEAVASARGALEAAGRRGLELELKAERAEEERARLARRVEALRGEIEAADEEIARLDDEARGARARLEEAEAAHAAADAALRSGGEALDALVAAARAIGEETAALRAEAAAHEQRAVADAREREGLERAIRDLDARLEEAARERALAGGRKAEAEALLRETEGALAGRVEAVAAREGEASRTTQEIEERRRELREREESGKRARAELEEARARSREAELARVRAEGERGHLDDLCVQELGCRVDEAAAVAGPALASDPPPSLSDVEATVGELKGRIEGIGPVNLTAIEEFQELEERHAFLSSQKKDLEDSIGSLRDSIRRINRSSRERFASAFEEIRTNYREIFRVLFNGGRADLVLEEGEDVLESGIDMIAQPPGKRLGNVSLLSGGEKSMAAIALLFAIFRYRPSPFCLLDEVDAALDDTNVNRFTRMLREYAETTQFILVTHNKRSMESADFLYGVTMEEPGVSRLVSLRI